MSRRFRRTVAYGQFELIENGQLEAETLQLPIAVWSPG
jgi:hypothetical protein